MSSPSNAETTYDFKSKYVRLYQCINEHFDEYISDRCKTRPSTEPILDDWWLAMIQALEPNIRGLHMTFLHPPGLRTSFKFPVRQDELNIELGNVKCLLSQPLALGTQCNYTIPQPLCD
ncbi:unnamed protein product [Rotaria magnacalcarata]|uniref:Uncharacterized protein n=1 Tax=Rotaria magnacalcarata TaxID=392030 RepID=A0A819VXV5_9BILA|nr:unnamed protein product [Rotaria magnacalcarata]